MSMRRYFWSLSLVIGGLILASAITHFHQWRPLISYWLKHKPLCMAENAGLLLQRRAHYSKEVESTVDTLYCTPTKPPKLEGGALAHDLIILSDFGEVVQRIGVDGRLMWQRSLSKPHGLDLQGGKLFVGEGQTLRVLSLATGEDLQTFEFDQPLLMMRQKEMLLYTVMNYKGRGSIRRYNISTNKAELEKASLFEASYPRGLDIDASGLYVADTFGHRILRLDPNSLDILDESPSYFPNSVQVVNNRLLVTEEHLDKISNFDTRPLLRHNALAEYSEKSSNIHQKKDDALEMKQVQNCYLNSSIIELYSPNDVVAVNDYCYIADTDNHRVIELYKGKLVAQLTGFNSPVNVRFVAR
jgi:hypothetical protein